jgi:hypothetical protein
VDVKYSHNQQQLKLIKRTRTSKVRAKRSQQKVSRDFWSPTGSGAPVALLAGLQQSMARAIRGVEASQVLPPPHPKPTKAKTRALGTPDGVHGSIPCSSTTSDALQVLLALLTAKICCSPCLGVATTLRNQCKGAMRKRGGALSWVLVACWCCGGVREAKIKVTIVFGYKNKYPC